MSHHIDYGHLNFWILFIAAVGIFIGWLLFRPVRGWMWGTWLWFKGLLLGKRAARYDDVRRPGAEIDDNYNEIKARYVNAGLTDIKRWTSGPQKRLTKRLGQLKKAKEETQERETELEQKRLEERQNPPRERPRFKGPFYSVVAVLLAVADVAITFMCLQSLDYPGTFLIPSAIILGIIGYLAGEYLGRNIEPAQKNPNKEKNRVAIVLFASFSVMYCIILGTIRFLYTQRDASVSLELKLLWVLRVHCDHRGVCGDAGVAPRGGYDRGAAITGKKATRAHRDGDGSLRQAGREDDRCISRAFTGFGEQVYADAFAVSQRLRSRVAGAGTLRGTNAGLSIRLRGGSAEQSDLA